MSARVAAPILPLTSVRFIAALYVVLIHSVAMSDYIDSSTWGGRFLRSGYTAVGFFFVLSGYVLAHVYLDTERPFDRRAFWVSRFARAYPLLVASLLLDSPHNFFDRLSLHGLGSAIARSFVELIAECSLLQAWDRHFRNINAPSWSLSAEAFFYLLFPFVSFWIWRHKGRSAAGLFVVLWACSLLVPIGVTLRYPELFADAAQSTLQKTIELTPVFRVFEFLAGIALCSFEKALLDKLNARQMNRLAYLFVALACALFATAIEFGNHIPILAMSNGLLLPVSALMILGLANIRGWLAALLSVKWMVLLGEASYAVYLLHIPIWLYFASVHPIDTVAVWSVYLAVVIAVSIASFVFLEQPAKKKILALARRSR